jgi:predicted nuclease of restriction endonuclease-like (RecB) superfamily
MQIETALHQRQGKAIANFPATMPSLNSDLAIQTLKGQYNFDFLGLGD